MTAFIVINKAGFCVISSDEGKNSIFWFNLSNFSRYFFIPNFRRPPLIKVTISPKFFSTLLFKKKITKKKYNLLFFE